MQVVAAAEHLILAGPLEVLAEVEMRGRLEAQAVPMARRILAVEVAGDALLPDPQLTATGVLAVLELWLLHIQIPILRRHQLAVV